MYEGRGRGLVDAGGRGQLLLQLQVVLRLSGGFDLGRQTVLTVLTAANAVRGGDGVGSL